MRIAWDARKGEFYGRARGSIVGGGGGACSRWWGEMTDVTAGRLMVCFFFFFGCRRSDRFIAVRWGYSRFRAGEEEKRSRGGGGVNASTEIWVTRIMDA